MPSKEERQKYHLSIRRDFDLYLNILMEIVITHLYQKKIYEIASHYYNYYVKDLSTYNNIQRNKINIEKLNQQKREQIEIIEKIKLIENKILNNSFTIEDKSQIHFLKEKLRKCPNSITEIDLNISLKEKYGRNLEKELYRKNIKLKELINKENIFQYYDLGEKNKMFLIAIEKIFPGIFREPYRLYMRRVLNSTQLNSQIHNLYKTEIKSSNFSLGNFLFGFNMSEKNRDKKFRIFENAGIKTPLTKILKEKLFEFNINMEIRQDLEKMINGNPKNNLVFSFKPWKIVNICKYCNKLFKTSYNPGIIEYLKELKKVQKNGNIIQSLPSEIIDKIIFLGYNYGKPIPDTIINDDEEIINSVINVSNPNPIVQYNIWFKSYTLQKNSNKPLLFQDDINYPDKCSKHDGLCCF